MTALDFILRLLTYPMLGAMLFVIALGFGIGLGRIRADDVEV